MAGALFAIDQDRPSGTSFGTPGVPRKDLWLDRAVRPNVASPLGNNTYLWELLDCPLDSDLRISGVIQPITGSTTATPSFIPDVYGPYRLRCTVNGGGAGNVVTLICHVRFDTSGALLRQGRMMPAFGETAAEDDFTGDGRGYATPFEDTELNTRERLEALEAAGGIVPPGSENQIAFSNGTTLEFDARLEFIQNVAHSELHLGGRALFDAHNTSLRIFASKEPDDEDGVQLELHGGDGNGGLGGDVLIQGGGSSDAGFKAGDIILQAGDIVSGGRPGDVYLSPGGSVSGRTGNIGIGGQDVLDFKNMEQGVYLLADEVVAPNEDPAVAGLFMWSTSTGALTTRGAGGLMKLGNRVLDMNVAAPTVTFDADLITWPSGILGDIRPSSTGFGMRLSVTGSGQFIRMETTQSNASVQIYSNSVQYSNNVGAASANLSPTGLRLGDLTAATERLEVMGNIAIDAGVAAPKIYQKNLVTNSGVGQALTLQAQNATGTTSTGGEAILLGGTGTSVNGNVRLATGSGAYARVVVGGVNAAWISLYGGDNTFGSLWLGTGTPTAVNYTLAGKVGGDTFINTATNVVFVQSDATGVAMLRPPGSFYGLWFLDLANDAEVRFITNPTNSATGRNLTLRAQTVSGTTSIGGNLVLASGAGTSTNGYVQFTIGTSVLGRVNSHTDSPTTIGSLWLGSASPSSTNFAILSDGLTTVINSGDTTSSIVFTVANTLVAAISGTATSPYGAPGLFFWRSIPADAVVGIHTITTNGVTGKTLLVRAQNATGTTTSGGALDLRSGTGTTTDGNIVLRTGATTRLSLSPTTATFTLVTVQWNTAVLAPALKQADNTTNSATAQALTVQAANATGTTSIGGDLNLTSGTGTSANGVVNLQNGGVTKLSVTSVGITVTGTLSATDISVTGTVTANSGGGKAILAGLSGFTATFGALYLGPITPGAANWAITSNGTTQTWLNVPTSGTIILSIGNSTKGSFTATGLRLGDASAPTEMLDIIGRGKIGVGAAKAFLDGLPGATATNGALWFGAITPSVTNYSLNSDGASLNVNVDTGGSLFFKIANVLNSRWNTNGLRLGETGVGPTDRLEVIGNTIVTGNIVANSGGTIPVTLRVWTSLSTYGAIYMVASPGTTNFTLLSEGSSAWLNAPSGSGHIYFTIGNVNQASMHSTGLRLGDTTATTERLEVVGNIKYDTTVVSPKLFQADNTTNSATATNLTVQAQHATGTTSVGGSLVLTSGTGTTAAGNVNIQTGGALKLQIGPNSIISTVNSIQWLLSVTNPILSQADNVTNSATAQTLTIQAQNATGTTSTGGALNLTTGTGTTSAGSINLQTGGTTRMIVAPTTIIFSLALLQWQSSVTSPILSHAQNVTNGVTGQTLLIRAQDCTGTTTTGGAMDIRTGTGTTVAGDFTLRRGAAFFLIATGASPNDYVQLAAGTTNGIFLDADVTRFRLSAGGSSYKGIWGSAGLRIGDSTPATEKLEVVGNVMFDSGLISPPKLFQANVTTNSATGSTLTVQAQNATGTTATGGSLVLTSGTGTTAAGSVLIQTGGVTSLTVGNTSLAVAVRFVDFGSTVVSPLIRQTVTATNSATGAALTVQAQSCSGTTTTGGTLILTSGTGTTVAGNVDLQTGAVSAWLVSPTKITLYGTITFSTGTAVPSASEVDGSVYFRSGSPNGSFYVRTNATWVLSGGFTAGGDLSGTSSSQQVIGLTGTSGTVSWATGATNPKINQADNVTNSATAQTLTIQAQNATGTTATGGGLNLTTGTGTTVAGTLNLQTGGTTRFAVAPAGITLGTSAQAHSFVGSIRYTTRAVSGTLTIDTTTTDYVLLVDTSAARSITLPAPTNGRVIVIVDSTGSCATNNITLIRAGSEKIRGVASSYVFTTNWGAWTVWSNGTDWFIQ